MANSLFQITKRPPKAAAQYKIVRDEVRVGLNRVGDRTVKAYGRVVQNWRGKPTFKSEVGSGTKQLFVRIKVTGKRRDIQNWKRGKFLRFVWGGYGSYAPKTNHSPARFGGSGKVANGKVFYLKKVNHPGFKPRKFSEAINKAAVPELNKEVRNGYRRGMRKAVK